MATDEQGRPMAEIPLNAEATIESLWRKSGARDDEQASLVAGVEFWRSRSSVLRATMNRRGEIRARFQPAFEICRRIQMVGGDPGKLSLAELKLKETARLCRIDLMKRGSLHPLRDLVEAAEEFGGSPLTSLAEKEIDEFDEKAVKEPIAMTFKVAGVPFTVQPPPSSVPKPPKSRKAKK